ncbi:uncharacterized protein LOC135204075 [Macrobrachium nipponense]|uniref:uncharacterized protein LOC135204075 n=1 Tax=Macrobrachium nipponense TaxID=159736 RepID=UPI0030C803E6
MQVQGTMIRGRFVRSSLAIGLMISGKVLLIPGIILIIFGSTADCDDYDMNDTCSTLIIIGSLMLTSGLGVLVAGIVIYYQVRTNPVRLPLLPQAVMTVGPAGSYPGISQPATLHPSSTTYAVPPGHMAQGMPAPPPYGQMPTSSYQTNYGFASGESYPPPTEFRPKP